MANKPKNTRNNKTNNQAKETVKVDAAKVDAAKTEGEVVTAPVVDTPTVDQPTDGDVSSDSEGSDAGVVIEGTLVQDDIEPGDGVQLGTDAPTIVLSTEAPSAESLDSGTAPAAERGESAVFQHVDEAPFIPDTSKAKIIPADKPVESVFTTIAAGKAAPESKGLVLIRSSLDRYAAVMAPGVQHSIRDGARAQSNFYRTVMRVLALEGQEFYQGMDIVTKFVVKHRKAMFAETHAFRYFDSVELTISSVEVKNFERLMHVLITLSNPHIRPAALKQIDLSAALSGLSDQQMHQRVVEYFTS